MKGDEAADLTFDQLPIGREFVERYQINDEVYRAFLAVSQDHSPIHVDDAYAQSRGFLARVTHGAILNGFVSHLVGMRAPGRRALLQAMDLRYATPCYIGDVIVVRATVTQRSEAVAALVLNVELFNETRGVVAARGKVNVGVAT